MSSHTNNCDKTGTKSGDRIFECFVSHQHNDLSSAMSQSPFVGIIRYKLKMPAFDDVPIRVMCHTKPKGREMVLLSIEVTALTAISKLAITVPLPSHHMRAPESKPQCSLSRNKTSSEIRWPLGIGYISLKSGEAIAVQVCLAGCFLIFSVISLLPNPFHVSFRRLS